MPTMIFATTIRESEPHPGDIPPATMTMVALRTFGSTPGIGTVAAMEPALETQVRPDLGLFMDMSSVRRSSVVSN